jgi:hypothetical protein
VSRALLRARQIKALYQRELTALHRRPGLAAAVMREEETRLWCQAAAQLARLEREAEAAGLLGDEDRALLAAPAPPEGVPVQPETSA